MSGLRREIAEPVRRAIAKGEAVVALESTIITHGMPHPANLETALAVEDAVRESGATPATIAIIDGVIRIGLDAVALQALAAARGVVKCSRRDLAYVLARGLSGSTTVAATMILAHQAGIRLFATGGLGGVHRGAERTMDVSADLLELGRTPVAVVCAGAKSILDLGLTLEVLETQGVPVIGYGTDRFPAFYLPDSGFALEQRADSPEELAAILAQQHALGLESGLVIANPIPAADALDPLAIEQAITGALAEAEAAGIAGKALTPFLLGRLNATTVGRALAANRALILHNARLAGRIAVALAAQSR